MGTENPKRRLVPMRQYLVNRIAKGGLYSTSVTCLGIGATLFLITGLLSGWTIVAMFTGEVGDAIIGLILADLVFGAATFGMFWLGINRFVAASRIETWEGSVIGFVAIGSLTSLLLISCRSLFRRAKKIEPVTLLTPQKAHLLPPEECLVRASDLPPSQQQTELLRAAKYGNNTPSEELLRASRTDGTGM